MNHEEILNNRATRTEDGPREVFCPVCDEPVVFALRDNQHTFSLGLKTVLECLYFAEKEGYLPSLPDDWWVQIENVYQISLYSKEELDDECVQTENNGLGSQSH